MSEGGESERDRGREKRREEEVSQSDKVRRRGDQRVVEAERWQGKEVK